MRLQNHQPNSGTKSMYSMWIALPKPPVAEMCCEYFGPEGVANSPDTNLLDLGFFCAVQSANNKVMAGEGEMIEHIQQTFANYLRQLINRTWLTYMSCLNMIITHLWDNDYPHEQEQDGMGRYPLYSSPSD